MDDIFSMRVDSQIDGQGESTLTDQNVDVFGFNDQNPPPDPLVENAPSPTPPANADDAANTVDVLGDKTPVDDKSTNDPAAGTKPEEIDYSTWTQAAKFGVVLTDLEPLTGIEINPDDSMQTIKEKIASSWTQKTQEIETQTEKKFQDYKGYVDYIQAGGQDSLIKELAPLKVLAALPLQASETVDADQVLKNANAIVKSYYESILDDPEEIAALLATAAPKIMAKAEEAQTYFKQTHDNILTEHIQATEAALKAEEDAEISKLEAIETEIKGFISAGKLFGNKVAKEDLAAINDAIYGKPTEVIETVVKDKDGKPQKKQEVITKAERAIREFHQKPEYQLWYLLQYLRGDFKETKLRQNKDSAISQKLAEELDSTSSKLGEDIRRVNSSPSLIGTIQS